MADNEDEKAALGNPNSRAGRRSGMFRSLANRNYRLWAAGSLVSNVGTWMQRTALAVVFFVPAVPARNLLDVQRDRNRRRPGTSKHAV